MAPKGAILWSTGVFWALYLAVLAGTQGAIAALFQVGETTKGMIFTSVAMATGGFISASVVGLVLGLLIGAGKMLIPNATVSRFTRKSLAGAAALGLCLGAFQMARHTPQSYFASQKACSASKSEASQAAQLDTAHKYQDAYNMATSALTDNSMCQAEDEHTANAAIAYFSRMAAESRMQKSYDADAKNAHDALASCISSYGGTDSDDPDAKTCGFMLQATERYLTQHFCDESFNLASQADSKIAKHDYQGAAKDAGQAVALADKCKNSRNYAYKGIALLEQGSGLYMGGSTNDGTIAIQHSSPLLDRCVSELTGASDNKELLSACTDAQSVVHQWLQKIAP